MLGGITRCVVTAPLAGVHNAAYTTTLGGYVIPKDTVILTNYYSLHLDPKLWPKPRHFSPGRFLQPDGQLKTNVKNFMPFGLGQCEVTFILITCAVVCYF